MQAIHSIGVSGYHQRHEQRKDHALQSFAADVCMIRHSTFPWLVIGRFLSSAILGAKFGNWMWSSKHFPFSSWIFFTNYNQVVRTRSAQNHDSLIGSSGMDEIGCILRIGSRLSLGRIGSRATKSYVGAAGSYRTEFPCIMGASATKRGPRLGWELKGWHRESVLRLEGSQGSVCCNESYIIEGSVEGKLPTIWRDGIPEVRRVREEKRRREKIREEKESEDVRRKKMQGREKGRKVAIHCPMICGSEGSKRGSLKRRVRSHLARWEMKNCTPLWREAHSEVKSVKDSQVRTTFGSWKKQAAVAQSTFGSQKC